MNTPPGTRPRGRTENRGAAFEHFVLRVLERDPEIELAAGMAYGPHGFRRRLDLWDGSVDPG